MKNLNSVASIDYNAVNVRGLPQYGVKIQLAMKFLYYRHSVRCT